VLHENFVPTTHESSLTGSEWLALSAMLVEPGGKEHCALRPFYQRLFRMLLFGLSEAPIDASFFESEPTRVVANDQPEVIVIAFNSKST